MTLHNSALLHERAEADTAVEKLEHLLAGGGAAPCPPPTLSNIALLLCRAGREQEAAELLDRHAGADGAPVAEVRQID